MVKWRTIRPLRSSHESFESELFTPEEQRQIIEVAAQLQRRHGGVASRPELEKAASELGIDPHFVSEAIARVRGSEASAEPEGVSFGLRILIVAFLFAQWFAIFTMLNGSFGFGFGARGEHLWLVIGLSAILGAAVSNKKRAYWIGAALIGLSTVVMAILTGLFLRVIHGYTGDNWALWLRNLLAVEAVLFLVGNLVGKGLSKITPDLPHAPTGRS